jgi:hypothetical protein
VVALPVNAASARTSHTAAVLRDLSAGVDLGELFDIDADRFS